MLQESVALGRHRARDLSVRLAQSPSEIREAQKLRWRVFADEMGARLNPRNPAHLMDCEFKSVSAAARHIHGVPFFGPF